MNLPPNLDHLRSYWTSSTIEALPAELCFESDLLEISPSLPKSPPSPLNLKTFCRALVPQFRLPDIFSKLSIHRLRPISSCPQSFPSYNRHRQMKCVSPPSPLLFSLSVALIIFSPVSLRSLISSSLPTRPIFFATPLDQCRGLGSSWSHDVNIPIFPYQAIFVPPPSPQSPSSPHDAAPPPPSPFSLSLHRKSLICLPTISSLTSTSPLFLTLQKVPLFDALEPSLRELFSVPQVHHSSPLPQYQLCHSVEYDHLRHYHSILKPS